MSRELIIIVGTVLYSPKMYIYISISNEKKTKKRKKKEEKKVIDNVLWRVPTTRRKTFGRTDKDESCQKKG